MTIRKEVQLSVDQKFDPRRTRHLVNGTTYVLHCHHYATLYCRLADDAEIFDGKSMLRRASESAFYNEFVTIFEEHEPEDIRDAAKLIEDYFRFAGLGRLSFERLGGMAIVARMDNSHTDEGWVKKWGTREEPVNFIGQGFLAAAAAAIFEENEGSYNVEEQQSIVSGAEYSRFVIVRR